MSVCLCVCLFVCLFVCPGNNSSFMFLRWVWEISWLNSRAAPALLLRIPKKGSITYVVAYLRVDLNSKDLLDIKIMSSQESNTNDAVCTTIKSIERPFLTDSQEHIKESFVQKGRSNSPNIASEWLTAVDTTSESW